MLHTLQTKQTNREAQCLTGDTLPFWRDLKGDVICYYLMWFYFEEEWLPFFFQVMQCWEKRCIIFLVKAMLKNKWILFWARRFTLTLVLNFLPVVFLAQVCPILRGISRENLKTLKFNTVHGIITRDVSHKKIHSIVLFLYIIFMPKVFTTSNRVSLLLAPIQHNHIHTKPLAWNHPNLVWSSL